MSISNVDILGNILSKEQMNYFKDSQMKNSKNNLFVFYHGTGGDNIQVFSTNKPVYFSRVYEYARDIALSDDIPYVYEVYLNIKNPLLIDNTVMENYKSFIEKNGIEDSQIGNYNGKYISTFLVDNDKNNFAFYNFVKSMTKYDGLIVNEDYENYITPRYGKDGNFSYIPFFGDQIKLISNKQPILSADIRK